MARGAQPIERAAPPTARAIQPTEPRFTLRSRLYGNLVRLLGSTFIPWMNPYREMQPLSGKITNLTIAWPTLQPTMDAAIAAARDRQLPPSNQEVDWAAISRPYAGPPPKDHPGWRRRQPLPHLTRQPPRFARSGNAASSSANGIRRTIRRPMRVAVAAKGSRGRGGRGGALAQLPARGSRGRRGRGGGAGRGAQPATTGSRGRSGRGSDGASPSMLANGGDPLCRSGKVQCGG